MATSGMCSLGRLHIRDTQVLQLVRAAGEVLMYRTILASQWDDTISGCGDIRQEPRSGITAFAHPLDLAFQASDNINEARGATDNVLPDFESQACFSGGDHLTPFKHHVYQTTGLVTRLPARKHTRRLQF
jgi:hypothetical protein